MTRTWIEAITNRTYGNIQEVQSNPTLENAIGVWNAVDLNRIEQNTAYCVEYMLEQKIYHSDPALTIRENNYWTGDMIPTYTEISRIINNVSIITEYAREHNANVSDLPTIYSSTHIDYILANNIETALDILHTQPKPSLDYFTLTIDEGIITTIQRADGTIEEINASEALIAEDEIATIKGIPGEPDAEYKIFQFWSGNADDLQYLADYQAQETTYLGQYRNVKFTANFQTKIPRTLTLTDAYISINNDDTAESGPSTGTYYAGDTVMIIANRASSGKRFYQWTGTEDALDNIVGVTSKEDPSTAWLTMPDCDVELVPQYINAGAHTVTVKNSITGVSTVSSHEYNDYVSISADAVDHYSFSNWSGEYTSYLTDIYSSYQSFKMPDINLTFTANYDYVYSYNDVQIINGYISYSGENVSSVSSVKQTSTLALAPNPPDDTYGFDYWEVEGYGSVSGNTFIVGDGNAIITGHYALLQTLTVINVNNGGGTTTYKIVQGHSQTLTTSSTVGDYRFVGWYENGTKLSTSTSYTVKIDESDRTIEARYEYYSTYTYTVTLINKNNDGTTTTSQVLSGNSWSSSTTEDVGDYLFVCWLKNGSQVSTSTSYSFTVTDDTTIECEYRQKETYYLTVNNGSGSGYYKERLAISITADDGNFSDWTYSNLYSISSSTSKTTTVKLGRQDGTVTANYNLRQITVITHSGTNTYAVRQGAGLSIDALPAPDTWEWDTSVGWTIDEGGTGSFANSLRSSTTFYASTTDATIRAHYKEIPYFTITVENGYVQDVDGNWVESTARLRNSAPVIQMKPAPEGMKFLQWETLEGTDNDVYAPFAETTYIRDLLHDVRVRATYYTPDPEATYTLTIIRYDGTTDTYHNSAGYRQKINCSTIPEGMKFYRWEGDYQYLMSGRYIADNYVNTPEQDITIEEKFVAQDWTPTYHLYMKGYSECMYETTTTDSETGETTITENWTEDHEYEENEVVNIRIKDIPYGWKFAKWDIVDVDGNSHNDLLENLTAEKTIFNMPDYDLYITALIEELEKYMVILTNGQPTNQSYYEGERAEIYFEKITEESKRGDVIYQFDRWYGRDGTDITTLKDYDTGTMFNVLVAGTAEEPQYIKMPAYDITLEATYTSLYHFTITNGIIKETELDEGYYKTGTTLNIIANDAEAGQKFVRWDGDTAYIKNPYDPTTTVTIPDIAITVKAIYALEQDQNGVGYSETSLINITTITKDDINIISGEINTGFLIIDNKGHHYVITEVDSITNDLTIARLTKINKGGNIYE